MINNTVMQALVKQVHLVNNCFLCLNTENMAPLTYIMTKYIWQPDNISPNGHKQAAGTLVAQPCVQVTL